MKRSEFIQLERGDIIVDESGLRFKVMGVDLEDRWYVSVSSVEKRNGHYEKDYLYSQGCHAWEVVKGGERCGSEGMGRGISTERVGRGGTRPRRRLSS